MNSISKVAWKEQINLRWVRWIFRKQTPWRIFFIRDHGHARSVPHVACCLSYDTHTEMEMTKIYLHWVVQKQLKPSSPTYRSPLPRPAADISPIPRYWPIINLLKSVLPLNCHVNYFHIAKNLLRYVLNCEKNISNH